MIDGSSDRAAALAAYESFNSGHKRPFAIALALQRLIPALPPRLLTALLAIIGNQRIIDKAFGWYLDQAAPEFAALNPRNEATKVDDPNVLAGVSR